VEIKRKKLKRSSEYREIPVGPSEDEIGLGDRDRVFGLMKRKSTSQVAKKINKEITKK